MVGSGPFIHIIGEAGIEYCVHAALNQGFYMTVHEFAG